MGKFFDSTMKIEQKITKTMFLNKGELLVILFASLLAIYARLTFFPHEARDYTVFLSPWFDQLAAAGGFPGLALSLGDYTPPYLYILAALTYIPLDSLTSIKLVSCIFDFILAFFTMAIVWNRWQKSVYTVLSYVIMLFAPTVLLNSSFWGQCDVIFTTFLVMCLWFFLKDRPFAATICFAVSFCFKLQAIFLAPFLVFMWCKNKMKLRHFLLIPGVYFISIIPTLIAGRPLKDLLTIYISQSGQYKALNYNAPNIYTLVEGTIGKEIATAGIIVCAAAVLITLYLLWMKKFKISNDFILTIALFYAILIPFLLPHMHERYFFSADILAIIFVFFRPGKFYVAILVNIASVIAYAPYLFRATTIPVIAGSCMMLLALIFIGLDICKQMKISDSFEDETFLGKTPIEGNDISADEDYESSIQSMREQI